MSGIAGVLSRIQSIEAMIGATTAGLTPPVVEVASRTSTTAGSSADFANLLAQATGTAGTTGAAALSGVAGITAAAPGEPTGADLVTEARKYIGVPYVWGGATASGLDCSGLVKLSLSNLGVDIKRVARQQMTEGEPVASLDEALPGDLVVFNNGTHIGIYVGDGRMIDAPYPGRTVTERDVYETPTAIRRVLPAQSATSTAQVLAQQAATAALSATSGLSAATALGTSPAALDTERLALALFSGGAA